MKKILKSLLILTALVAACILLNPTEAHAASESDLKIQFNGTSYYVYRCRMSACGELTIPATYNGLPVTAIANGAFSYCEDLTSITIPDSVTTIGNNAFEYCTALTSVTIPDSVTSIGYSAFRKCTSLTSVTIPGSLTAISTSMFDECTGLTNVTIENGVTGIGYLAFTHCTSLTSITIPDSVIGMNGSAFNYCTSLKSVTIPDSVTDLGGSTFRYCTGLTSVTIGKGIKEIGYSEFEHCTSLTSITIPDNITTIGDYAFRACTGLTSVTIPNSVTSIGYNAFSSCTGLTSVTIGSGVTAIGNTQFRNGAFNGCTALTAVRVDKANPNYCSDSRGVLFNKDKTALITVPGAFTTYTIPSSVTTIDDYAFANCTKLTGIAIPSNVTAIGDSAFLGCTGLTNVTIPNSVTTIGEKAFQACISLTSITIPDSITAIPEEMFYACEGLTSVTIPDSVTVMGNRAFAFCYSLTAVTIPGSITTVGQAAFDDCTALKSVTIASGVTAIGSHAFTGCTGLTGITIPDSVTSIHGNAFLYCSGLTNITIPDSVTNIGDYAFTGCTGLTDVYYTGTRTAWDSIDFNSYNTYLQNATLHFVLCETNGHTYDGENDAVCNVCSLVRQIVDTYKFENYRVVLADNDTTHKNIRVEVYSLGDKTVSDPSDEKALKAIDSSPVTHWGIGNINKILITDAGNYVLLLKYNVGTGSATKVPMVLSVSDDPKLIIDKNNKLTSIDDNGANINHRVVVYYLGEKTVEDIYDEAALKAIDSAPETVWQKTRINKLALVKGGNYVLHLCYNVGTGAKQTVAQQFTVESIPALSVDINNKVVVTEENAENKNHRAVVYYLGENTVEDPYSESAVKAAAATTSKTYWGLSEINKLELKEGGNYVIHLYYNVGTSEKRTLALDVTVNERPALSLSEDNKLVVTYTDPEVSNPRAYIYKVDDASVSDIYDEAALKKIAAPTQVWGLSSILKTQLTESGTYVIHFYYSIGTSAKKTVALKVTI